MIKAFRYIKDKVRTIKQFVSKPEKITISDLATKKRLEISATKKPLDVPLYKIIGDSTN